MVDISAIALEICGFPQPTCNLVSAALTHVGEIHVPLAWVETDASPPTLLRVGALKLAVPLMFVSAMQMDTKCQQTQSLAHSAVQLALWVGATHVFQATQATCVGSDKAIL